MATALSIIEMCYGDTALLLSMPRQGLGNSAIAAVANEEQRLRFKNIWAAMAITEPQCGSDSASIRTTATRDGDDYILNGEKIFVTSGQRADAIVVWATLDPKLGRAAIKSSVVLKETAGMTVERLEHKLGIKASDTATIRLIDCRVPAKNLLGNADIEVSKGFAGVMQTFDNTRPLVAAMAIGCAKASLERIQEIFKDQLDANYATPYLHCSHLAAQIYRMQAEWEAARLLTLKAAWMADNNQPNSREASIAKAKAGRIANEITLKCVELAGSLSDFKFMTVAGAGTQIQLATSGAAVAYSGVSVSSFQNFVSVQSASRVGIASIGDCAVTLARAESLDAHANAVVLRLREVNT